jgi:hypothetical protein
LEKILKKVRKRDRRKTNNRDITSKLLNFMSAVIPEDVS